jgi:hypothetical protein
VKPMRALAATTFTALALVAAGCGGSSSSSGSASGSAGAAALVPRDAAAYVAVNTDLKSSQWKQVDDLLNKFPSKDRLLQSLRGDLAKQGVDFDSDVKPALGDEIDVAVLVTQTGSRQVVALTKPKDEAKFDALLKKGSPPHPVHEKVDGWTVVAQKQAGLDAVKAASKGSSLQDDSAFGDAFGKLPGDAVAKFFVRGSAARSLGAGSLGPLGAAVPAASSLEYVTGALVAEDDGFRVDGVGRSSGNGGGASYTSKLVSQVPAGAYLFVSFHGSKQSLAGLRSNPALGQQLPQIERALGVSLDQIGALFRNEVAIYVRQGTPIPEISLVSLVDDEAAARATLNRLTTRLGALTGGAPKATTIDGVAARQLVVGGRFSVYTAVFDGKLVVTTAPGGISGLRDGGQKLTADPVFKSAKSAAKLPDSTTGFVFLNLKDAIPLLQNLAQLGGQQIPSQVSGNLAPLRSFLAYATKDGSETRFTAFLQLQ